MKKIGIFILILTTVLTVTNAFGQKSRPHKKKDDRKSETKEVQVFGAENEEYFKENPKAEYFNIIKFNPLVALIGDFPIYYERVVDKRISVEGMLGLTYRPTYSWVFFDILDTEYTSQNFDGFLTPKPGVMAGVDAKFYVGDRDYAPEGFYIAAGSRLKRYNATSTAVDEYGELDETAPRLKTPVTIFDYARIYSGWSIGSGNVFTDIFMGFSMRGKNITRNDPYYNEQTLKVENNVVSKKKTTTGFYLGIKIGFAF